ncbi:MAG: hypothetical protein WKF74_03000 [Pyrinomonadaceae bacterium]
MNKKKATILLILLLLTSSGVGQQRTNLSSVAQSFRTFTEVKGQPEYLPSSFEFSTSDYKYRISSRGRGRRTGSGITPRSFNLRLDKGDSLERAIYHAEYQGDVLLLCEVSDGDGGAGFITRLDGRTLRMKWKRWIPAFNIGQGLVEDNFAYVTAHGFVGKVNLKSGAFVWKHDNLFRDGDTFNVFELPRIEGEAALFKENTIYNPPAKTIKVHKRSGKIISIG